MYGNAQSMRETEMDIEMRRKRALSPTSQPREFENCSTYTLHSKFISFEFLIVSTLIRLPSIRARTVDAASDIRTKGLAYRVYDSCVLSVCVCAVVGPELYMIGVCMHVYVNNFITHFSWVEIRIRAFFGYLALRRMDLIEVNGSVSGVRTVVAAMCASSNCECERSERSERVCVSVCLEHTNWINMYKWPQRRWRTR